MRRAAGSIIAIIALASIAFGPPAEASTVTRHAGRFVYVTQSDTVSPGNVLEAADCPTGTSIVGGGGAMGGGLFAAHITGEEIKNFGGPPREELTGVLDGTSSQPARSIAICLTGAAQSALEYAGGASGVAAESSEERGGGCGIPGSVILGGGTDFPAPADTDRLEGSFPDPPTVWVLQASDFSNTAVSIESNIVCVPSGTLRIRIVSKVVIVRSLKARTVKVSCPSRFHVASGGFSSGPSGVVFSSVPIDRGDRDKAPDEGWAVHLTDQSFAPMAVGAYAVCVK